MKVVIQRVNKASVTIEGVDEYWDEDMVKKNDVILIISFLLLALFSLVIILLQGEKGGVVLVSVNGEEHIEFNLSEDISYTIDLEDGRYNTLIIKDEYAYISEASCPDKICVNHKGIQMSGETIICAPNKVVIEIKSESKSEIDAISN